MTVVGGDLHVRVDETLSKTQLRARAVKKQLLASFPAQSGFPVDDPAIRRHGVALLKQQVQALGNRRQGLHEV
ncbi:hypothetical protein, partial [Acinetobacter baumannii]|uniref:hypothetical protein n=1 Tax=Acinetobacter baumannii TaxID=470 RepID=UPI001BB465AE